MDFGKEIASYLLQIGAVKISPDKPFTWASGWHSPIYCDNRKTLSYPVIRSAIRDAFVQHVKARYPQAELIAGVATGAIAIGMLVAQELQLPFVYVRSKPKGHGMENLIEGDISMAKNVVVIEDLISTGGSSLQAVEALRGAGLDVLGMLAIFTYGFSVSEDKFRLAGVHLETLSNYHTLIQFALENQMIQHYQLESLSQWRINPSEWGK